MGFFDKIDNNMVVDTIKNSITLPSSLAGSRAGSRAGLRPVSELLAIAG